MFGSNTSKEVARKALQNSVQDPKDVYTAIQAPL